MNVSFEHEVKSQTHSAVILDHLNITNQVLTDSKLVFLSCVMISIDYIIINTYALKKSFTENRCVMLRLTETHFYCDFI